MGVSLCTLLCNAASARFSFLEGCCSAGPKLRLVLGVISFTAPFLLGRSTHSAPQYCVIGHSADTRGGTSRPTLSLSTSGPRRLTSACSAAFRLALCSVASSARRSSICVSSDASVLCIGMCALVVSIGNSGRSICRGACRVAAFWLSSLQPMLCHHQAAATEQALPIRMKHSAALTLLHTAHCSLLYNMPASVHDTPHTWSCAACCSLASSCCRTSVSRFCAVRSSARSWLTASLPRSGPLSFSHDGLLCALTRHSAVDRRTMRCLQPGFCTGGTTAAVRSVCPDEEF